MKNLLTMIVGSILLSSTANAEIMPRLSKYFDDRVSLVRTSTQSTADPLGSAIERAQVVDINIDFIAQASFGLSDVFKLSITPEIDFVLTPNEETKN